MRILQINTFPYKATGSLMMSIHEELKNQGIDSYVVWGRGRKPENTTEYTIEDKVGMICHGLFTRITDRTGFASVRATKKLIKYINDIKPTIVHLHNIHGYYVNIEMLLNYLKKNNISVVWTLHDCWPMTGHCAYFSMVGCEKWKSGCHTCPQLSTYPASKFLDSSKWNWKKKKKLYEGLDLSVVTVSQWLKAIVEESILKDAKIHTIYNGVNSTTFRYKKSFFREKYNIKESFVVLGVASEWTERKGLSDFIDLADWLPVNYTIVLVGLTKNQINSISSKRIIPLPRTSNIEELVEIYSSANVFFNPSVEETMGMTTIEAMLCGTPSVVYNATALPEVLRDMPELIVEPHDLEGAIAAFKKIQSGEYNNVDFVNIGRKYSIKSQNDAYLKLYNLIGRDIG